MMDYQQTLNYLYEKLPMFTRVGPAALKNDLSNTIALCAALDNPQDKIKTIHVAGTNGKGSVSHMIAAILQTAGYKTGLYTSPHLKDFRERIRINGEMIPQEEVIAFVKDQQDIIEQLSPSFFEVTVAMAFNYFTREKIDIAVIEVGLGGRLDSTNVIHPEISVITNISMDHTNILGDTLQQIAFEKAGIIKLQTPVVIGQLQETVQEVFIRKAKAEQAKIIFASEQFTIDENILSEEGRTLLISDQNTGKQLKILTDLTGIYQLKNILTVLASVACLNKKGFLITDEHLQKALANVKSLTGLKGRWQTLQKDPLVICDTGHNEDGMREVVKNIEATDYQNLHMVIGMVKDKDISKVLSLLPKNAAYYFCAPDLPRAKPAIELQQEAIFFKLKGEIYSDVSEAFKNAREAASQKDLIFVGGSTFVVAEVIPGP